MSELKVAFIPTGVSGVVFYRAWQPCNALKDVAGLKSICWWFRPDQYTMHPWENELSDPQKGQSIHMDINAACEWADVVVWMALHHPGALELFREMKNRHDKIFFTEIDDYIFSIPQKNEASLYFRPGSDFFHIAVDQLRESDGLVVSTPYLGELYREFNKNIHVVENCIDAGLWNVRTPGQGDKVRVGWVGGGTHEEDHEVIKDAVFELLDEHPNLEFYFMHGVPRFFRGNERIKFTLDFKPIDKYPQWVMKTGFDIGIAPLEDNNFNRGKSNLRWLEYSAMGIPTVASPLPHFRQSIRHGETGLLAETKDEWKYNLKQLITSKALRHSIGLNARKEIEDRWSMRHLRETYKSVVEGVHNANLHAGAVGGPSGEFDRGCVKTAVG